MLYYEYIHKVRPALLKNETDRLVLTPRTIRQSGLKELQAAIEKHHPLG